MYEQAEDLVDIVSELYFSKRSTLLKNERQQTLHRQLVTLPTKSTNCATTEANI